MELSLDSYYRIELDASDIGRYLPELKKADSLEEAARQYLSACFSVSERLINEQYHPQQVNSIQCKMIDRFMVFLFEAVDDEVRRKTLYQGGGACLMAQGGYGRREMSLFSDIDLLFIHHEKRGAYIENLTERMLYLMWDLKLEVGYATRTISECKKLILDDVTIMTSLLDARLLCGNAELGKQLLAELDQVLRSKAVRKRLMKAKLSERLSRLKRYGNSVFVLEPNVKESAGGLRDLQTPLWIAKIMGTEGTYQDLNRRGYLSDEGLEDVVRCRHYLWGVRNQLHLLNKKKNDLLSFDKQEALAQRYGFKNQDSGILAVEQFMQTYYKVAYRVFNITDTVIRRLENYETVKRKFFWQRSKRRRLDGNFFADSDLIQVVDRKIFRVEPLQILQLFRWVQLTQLSIHPDLRDHMRRVVVEVDDQFRSHPEAAKLFRQMLSEYRGLGKALQAMHECHFMDEWLPEFKKLRFRVQHDIYHTYTVDIHSVFAVNEISKLASGDYDREFPQYKQVLLSIKKAELLTLGLFLHDIGKGEGGNHSEKGAVIANQITKRLGFKRGEQKKIEFLVLAHLVMPHLSQRRDLDDPELIIQFAKSMVSLDRLSMMFILTWADIRAVGPEAWTDWKGVLLYKLYQRAHDVLSKHEFSPQKIKDRMRQTKRDYVDQFPDEGQRQAFDQFLTAMPNRYLFAVPEADVGRHFRLYCALADQPVMIHFDFAHERDVGEIDIFTLNDPYAFSKITGVMLVHGLNIIRADVFQAGGGHTLFTLWISHKKGRAMHEDGTLERVRHDITRVLSGLVKVETLIEANRPPEYLIKKPLQRDTGRVNIDNVVSAYYTVIDIYAHDRLGLLYDLIKTLHNLGLFVEVSKIATKVEQVTDVFYVKDVFGHKITNAKKLRDIKRALSEVIGTPQ